MKPDIIEKNRRKKKLKLKSKLGCLLIILGFISFIPMGREFNSSIFQFKYFVIIFICFGTILHFLLSLYFKDPLFNKETVSKVFLWASISMAIMFYTNKLLAYKPVHAKTFVIIEKKIIEGRQNHFSIIIRYNDFLQEIQTNNNTKEEIQKADSITIYLKQGIFQIETIEDTELK
jgi:hypothetical protein